ncbi:MAG: cytidylate kinase-like family protein [Clostridia bacterium]|nr:cytidylate kinase-like family protein [Clostridia bacterium]
MNHKHYPIITISREYGSGGHDIGKALAKRLDIPFYDNELIALAARESGYSETSFHEAEDSATNSFLYAMKMIATGGDYGVPLNNQLFMVQFATIRKIVDEGPAVIVGRCADYVVRNYKNALHIFIQSEMPHRVRRVMERTGETSLERAEAEVRKKDKCRATYYNFYTDRRWGDRSNYDLVINTATVDYHTAVDLLELYVRNAMSKSDEDFEEDEVL